MVYTFQLSGKCKYFQKVQEHKIKQLKTVTYLTSSVQTGLAWRQCVTVKSFLVYYYCVLKGILELWSIPRNILWVLDVFWKLFGFQQISQVSIKFSVRVHGNDFKDVGLDYVTVQKKLCV